MSAYGVRVPLALVVVWVKWLPVPIHTSRGHVGMQLAAILHEVVWLQAVAALLPLCGVRGRR